MYLIIGDKNARVSRDLLHSQSDGCSPFYHGPHTESRLLCLPLITRLLARPLAIFPAYLVAHLLCSPVLPVVQELTGLQGTGGTAAPADGKYSQELNVHVQNAGATLLFQVQE